VWREALDSGDAIQIQMHNTHFRQSDIASSSPHATERHLHVSVSVKISESARAMLNVKMLWNRGFIVVACLACTQMAMAQGAGNTAGLGIANTSHDPRIWSFGTETQICVMCHAPHNASSAGPLWNHAMSAVASYTMYSSPSTTAAIGQPGPVSKLCLSCHDGTVAIMAYAGAGGNAGGMTMLQASGAGSMALTGTDLSNDHPIGFVYDAALVAKDPTKLKPVSTSVTIGESSTKAGTIATLLLDGGLKVECSSCHDVHNKFTVARANGRGLVKVSTVGSALCVTCHIK
jgi:hypothetical protein